MSESRSRPTQSMADGLTMGQRVRALRRQRGLRQQDVAPVLGLARSAIANIEADRQRLTFDHAITLAAFFGVSLNSLAGEPVRPDAAVNAYDEGYKHGYSEGRSKVLAAMRSAMETAE